MMMQGGKTMRYKKNLSAPMGYLLEHYVLHSRQQAPPVTTVDTQCYSTVVDSADIAMDMQSPPLLQQEHEQQVQPVMVAADEDTTTAPEEPDAREEGDDAVALQEEEEEAMQFFFIATSWEDRREHFNKLKVRRATTPASLRLVPVDRRKGLEPVNVITAMQPTVKEKGCECNAPKLL